MTTDEFDAVVVGTFDETPASPPEPPDGWRGLVIRAPQTVEVERSSSGWAPLRAIPICGFFRLDVLAIPEQVELVVVATDPVTGDTHRGAFGDDDPASDVPAPQGPAHPDSALQGVFTEEYFNPDLVRTVGLPARPGRWAVHVELGKHRSNEITIQIEEAKP